MEVALLMAVLNLASQPQSASPCPPDMDAAEAYLSGLRVLTREEPVINLRDGGDAIKPTVTRMTYSPQGLRVLGVVPQSVFASFQPPWPGDQSAKRRVGLIVYELPGSKTDYVNAFRRGFTVGWGRCYDTPGTCFWFPDTTRTRPGFGMLMHSGTAQSRPRDPVRFHCEYDRDTRPQPSPR